MDFRVEMNIFDLIAQIERVEGLKSEKKLHKKCLIENINHIHGNSNGWKLYCR